jgi:hypothetical protein
VVAMKTRSSILYEQFANTARDQKKEVQADEIFSNMLVDCRKNTNNIRREAVRQFLRQEFGDKQQFSESFITRVLERLN